VRFTLGCVLGALIRNGMGTLFRFLFLYVLLMKFYDIVVEMDFEVIFMRPASQDYYVILFIPLQSFEILR